MKTAITGFDLLNEQHIDGRQSYAYDKAVTDHGALSVLRLEQWLQEIKEQPLWRREADKCADYYDGNQLDAETLGGLEEKGLGPLITNLIAPTVNAVLGMEAKTRTDWMVGADDDQWGDVADALSAKMHEVERESGADRACSDAYAGNIKAGFAAVEVSRNSNPFAYPYRVTPIHRSEIYWDWRSRQPDWSDARYVIRRKRYDADHLAAFFPQHADLIRATGEFDDWSEIISMETRMEATHLRAFDQGLRTTWDDLDWRDITRRQVTCYEVWYRVWMRGMVLRLPGGRVLEFNQNNPYHRAAVASGSVQPQVAVFDKIRCAFFCGPIRLMDRPTNRRRFPYIPFFGYREDLTGVPYGLIRTMLSPQDEVNARMARMMWLLKSRRAFMDSDALDARYNNLSDASRELGRSDALIITNPNRQNGANAIRVDDNMQLSAQQFQVMQERKQAIQEAAGVYNALMGQNSNASSGAALTTLVEQGVTTLAEINDNYRMARRLVGEELLGLIREDMKDQAEIVVDNGTAKRRVMVNIPAQTESGQAYKENDVQVAPVKVALADVPSTPTYRQQQFGQFAEILKSMPPEYQAMLVPFALEMSDFSRRKEMAEFLRKQLGIQADPESPEAQQAQAQAQQAQSAAAELQMADAQSKIEERQAKTEKTRAETAQIQQSADMPAQDDAGNSPSPEQLQSLMEQIQRLQQQLASREADNRTKLQQTAMHEEAETQRALIRAGAARQQPQGLANTIPM